MDRKNMQYTDRGQHSPVLQTCTQVADSTGRLATHEHTSLETRGALRIKEGTILKGGPVRK